MSILFRYYLPFKKGITLHLNKLECPLLKDTLCQLISMVKIGPVFLEKECFKFHQYISAILLLSPLGKMK